jgi:glycosyltransferase involved in cell wall biosynthesis
MAHSKPCVGSSVDSARCIIRHGETGLLVDHPMDLHEIAESLIVLLSQPELARKMGAAGCELLNSYYLFTHFQSRFIQILRQS